MMTPTAWLLAKARGRCPQCAAKMVVTSVTPVVFGNGHDDITYKCNYCGMEMTKTLRLNDRLRLHPRENRAA